MKADYHTSQKNYDSLRDKYLCKLKIARKSMTDFLHSQKNPEQLIHKAIALHALGVEKEYLQQMFTYNEIEEHLYLHRMAKIERQIGRAEAGTNQLQKS